MVDNSHTIEAFIFALMISLLLWHEYEKRSRAREEARKKIDKAREDSLNDGIDR